MDSTLILVLDDREMDESHRSGRIGGNIVLPSLPMAKYILSTHATQSQSGIEFTEVYIKHGTDYES
jgi:hypothetical protein